LPHLPGPFRLLWSANALSNLGDGLYQFALPVLALGTTHSPALISGVTVTLMLAWPVFGLHAGSIVDRFDRRSILLLVSGLRVCVLAVLCASIMGGLLSLPLLYIAAIALGVGETLADPALTSLVPAVVGSDELESANARIVAAQTVTNTFVGPPLAGALLGVGGAVLTGVATAIYGLAAIPMVSLRRRPGIGRPRGAASGNQGLTAGFRFLWRHDLLRRLTLFTAAMNLWWGAFGALFVLYAVAPGPLGLAPAELGLLFSAMAIGGLAGSVLTPRLVAAIGTRWSLALDFVGTAVLVGVPAMTAQPLAVGVALAIAGAASTVWIVLVSSIRQRITPDDLLGRAYAASRMISWGVLPVSAGFAGIAAEIVGIRAVFAAGAVATLIALGAFLISVSTGALDTASSRAERHLQASTQPVPDVPLSP
jgi:MFS family permease